MTRAREDETVHIAPQEWYREDKPTLAEQALHARIRREKTWTAAGWLAVAVLAVILTMLIPVAIYAWRMGGPLTGGGL